MVTRWAVQRQHVVDDLASSPRAPVRFDCSTVHHATCDEMCASPLVLCHPPALQPQLRRARRHPTYSSSSSSTLAFLWSASRSISLGSCITARGDCAGERSVEESERAEEVWVGAASASSVAASGGCRVIHEGMRRALPPAPVLCHQRGGERRKTRGQSPAA